MTKKNKKKQTGTPTSAQKFTPSKPVDDSDDSSDEVVQVKPQQKGGAKNTPVKTSKSPGGRQVVSKANTNLKKPLQNYESSSEEEDDDDDDDDDDVGEVLVNKFNTPVKKQEIDSKTGGKAVNVAEGSSEDDDDDDSDDDDDDDDDSDEEVTPSKLTQLFQQKKQPAQQVGGKNIAAEGSSPEDEDDSDDDDDDSEEQEAPKPVKQISKQKNIPVTQKQVQVEEDDDDDDDDDDEDSSEDEEDDEESEDEEADSDEEEEETVNVPESKKRKKVTQVPTAKKQKIQKDDDDSDDDDEDEEDEDVIVPESKKRKKKENAKKELTAKKQKLKAVNGGKVPVSLFLGNLNKSTTDEEITTFFRENNIIVTEVRKPPKRSNAFVDLENGDDLADALALNGSTLKSKTIAVEKAKPRSASPEKPQSTKASRDKPKKGANDKESRTLFVKQLPEDATSEGLTAIFDSAVDVRIPKKDNAHKGYGFIEFADNETLEEAMSEKQGVEYNGSSLFLDYMGSKATNKKQHASPDGRKGGFDGNKKPISSGARGTSSVLFVKNISYNTDESSLKAVFQGAVSARIPTFPDSGKPKGFAFVEFKTADAAEKAFDSMEGQAIDGRHVILDFAADKGSGGGGGGRGGFSHRGRGGGRGGGKDFGRGRGGGGRGGGFRGGRGGFNRGRGGQAHGKRSSFNDSD